MGRGGVGVGCEEEKREKKMKEKNRRYDTKRQWWGRKEKMEGEEGEEGEEKNLREIMEEEVRW